VDIQTLYEGREYGKAIRLIMEQADHINAYVDANKPWVLAKEADNDKTLHEVCSRLVEAFRLLTLYLKPVLPQVAKQVESWLNIEPLQWIHVNTALSDGHHINTYQYLLTRVDPTVFDALIEAPPEPATATNDIEKIGAEISIDDFSKVDLRIAQIVHCEAVDGSDKLLRLTLDAGEGRHRQVFSGIKSAYNPEQLIGKFTVMVANLAPRKMKFGVSEGMVLAASAANRDGEPGLYLLEPWTGAKPGMRVR
jgi:methionyl-tRNA synthetase